MIGINNGLFIVEINKIYELEFDYFNKLNLVLNMNVKILKGNISYTITLEEIALKALKTLNVGDCIVVSGYFKNRHRRKYIDRNNNYHDKFIVNDIIYTSN